MRTTACLLALTLTLVPFAAARLADADNHVHAAATQPTTAEFDAITRELGLPGELKDGVYTIALTRSDLEVRDDDGDIPPAVLRTEFRFYRCDCGKMNVVGQFCLAEYEANDVIDALRGGMMKVVSVSAAFQDERPRLTLLRFQGGGGSLHLAKTLKNALEWTGEARMAPATRPLG